MCAVPPDAQEISLIKLQMTHHFAPGRRGAFSHYHRKNGVRYPETGVDIFASGNYKVFASTLTEKRVVRAKFVSTKPSSKVSVMQVRNKKSSQSDCANL